MLIVGCPTYRKFDLCVRMIESANLGTLAPDYFLIMDNGAGGFEQYCTNNNIALGRSVYVINPGENLGVARSWNAMIKIVANNDPDALLLIVNDDIEFEETAIERMTAAYQEKNGTRDNESGNGAHVVYCAGGIDAPNAFSLFMVHPATFLNNLGPFDETLWPGYYDDNDMHYRMKMQGYDLTRVADVTAIHNEGGSATLKSYSADERLKHDHQFRRNGAYYMMKWGGMPGEEKYTTPFNGLDIVGVVQHLQQYYGF